MLSALHGTTHGRLVHSQNIPPNSCNGKSSAWWIEKIKEDPIYQYTEEWAKHSEYQAARWKILAELDYNRSIVCGECKVETDFYNQCLKKSKKCNLSEASLYCYVLVTFGWQAVTWCPAGVILNSRLDST